MSEIAVMNIPNIPEIQQELFTESFSTYTLTLAAVGCRSLWQEFYGSSKMTRIRKEIDSEEEGYQTEKKKVRECLD